MKYKYIKLKNLNILYTVIIMILILLLIVLLVGNNLLSNSIFFSNLSDLVQFITYLVTIVGGISILFYYLQYKNNKRENNREISNDTVKLLTDFVEIVMPKIDSIYNYTASYINDKNMNQSEAKEKSINDNNNNMGMIEVWCRCILIFENQNLIQEKIIYDESVDVFISFMKDYEFTLKNRDYELKYYKACYILYSKLLKYNK